MRLKFLNKVVKNIRFRFKRLEKIGKYMFSFYDGVQFSYLNVVDG